MVPGSPPGLVKTCRLRVAQRTWLMYFMGPYKHLTHASQYGLLWSHSWVLLCSRILGFPTHDLLASCHMGVK